jgi:hypothetical protein
MISTFTITAGLNDRIVVTHSGTDYVVTLTAGTYKWSDDGTASDFALMLDTVLEAGGSWAPPRAVMTWSVDIVGKGVTPAGYADGRIYYTASIVNFTFKTTSASWTLDPRVLGLRSGTDYASANGPGYDYLYSPDVHRYGWYPQTDAEEDLPTLWPSVETVTYSNQSRSSVDWGEYERGVFAWRARPSYLIRIKAAADATRDPTRDYLTLGDLNCALERFLIDLIRSVSRQLYHYPDITSHATVYGPYALAEEHDSNPLCRSSIEIRAGERWIAGIAVVQAV